MEIEKLQLFYYSQIEFINCKQDWWLLGVLFLYKVAV